MTEVIVTELHFLSTERLLKELRRRGYDVRAHKSDLDLAWNRTEPFPDWMTMDYFKQEALVKIKDMIRPEHLQYEIQELPHIEDNGELSHIPTKVHTARLLLW